MSRVLIVGGAGFIGLQIADYFKRNNIDVVIFDRNKVEHFESVILDITNYGILKENFLKYSFDCVIHLVNTQGIVATNLDFQKNYLTNIITLKNIIKCCILTNTHLIYTSSAAIYGIPEKIPIEENVEVNPVNQYGFFKYFAEQLIINEANKNNFNFTILRIFNIYTNEKGFGIINILFNAVKNNDEISLFNINQKRDYIHIEDLLLVFKKSINNSKIFNKIINIGSGIGYTTRDLIDIFLKFKKLNYLIKNSDLVEYDSIANISLLKELYSFQPRDIKFDLIKRLKND